MVYPSRMHLAAHRTARVTREIDYVPLQLSRYRPLRGRTVLILTATAVAVTGIGLAPVALAQPAASRTGLANTAAVRQLTKPGLRRLLLVNGDKLVTRKVPGGEASSLGPAPDGGPMLSLHLASGTFDVPADALPYFGHGLDPSLFNRALLAKHESGGRIPVKVTFAGSRPALPGITIKSQAGRVATGYLTGASAKVFGAALFKQFVAQHATGNYASPGMFAGGLSIALAGVPSSAPVRPQFPMHTVTVTGTNEAGKADSGDPMLLFNADNQEIFGDPFEIGGQFFHGVTKYSVPAGHYWAIADFLTPVKHNVIQRLVIEPQFTVSGGRKLHLSARSATSQMSFTTAKPVNDTFSTFSVIRQGGHGFPAAVNAVSFGNVPMFISPVSKKPSVGNIQSITTATLIKPAKVKGAAYAYNLDFPGPLGKIPSQHFDVTQASVATVHERFFLNAPHLGFWTTTGLTIEQATELGSFSLIAPIHLPAQQTQFMGGGPSVLWTSEFFVGEQGLTDAIHRLRAGHSTTENWNDYPLHPQSEMQLLTGRTGRKLFAFPTWFRTGNFLVMEPQPFSDNVLGHTGDSFTRGTFVLKQNGKEIQHGRYFGGVFSEVSAKPATDSLSITSTMSNPLSVLSPQTATSWTFRSARDLKARVPRTWACINFANFGITQKCAVPDVLTLNYQVSGLALNGVTPAGEQTIDVSVGNAEPGAATTIVKVSASVSYDGGKFFSPATVTRTGPGQYRVTFHAPAGVDVTTQFSATDSSGSSIAETITNGYSVGPQA